MSRKPRTTIRSWVKPHWSLLKICPVCGLDLLTVGLTSLAYTFEVHGDYLCEQLWHRECLREHDEEAS